ncbi:hypothetical protein BHE74_00007015 [Ensete ventricosum]|nr:hypothetical protein GW17_00039571 [Ensete ventricosum]RWW84382.1 hypothetical protein BHE74_00007015 [Ensete ventricosum]RZR89565.1 hypothetical protein BHM03_00017318 [Ensete ventricosum]
MSSILICLLAYRNRLLVIFLVNTGPLSLGAMLHSLAYYSTPTPRYPDLRKGVSITALTFTLGAYDCVVGEEGSVLFLVQERNKIQNGKMRKQYPYLTLCHVLDNMNRQE